MTSTIQEPRLDAAVRESLTRADEIAAKAKAMQAEADEMRREAAAQVKDGRPCPEWCTAVKAKGALDRKAHEWRWGLGIFSRFHLGVMNGNVVEQIETLAPNGESRTSKVHVLRKGTSL